MLSPWRGNTTIESCESPDALLRFIERRIPQINEGSMGNPHEEAEFPRAVRRLVELCKKGELPAAWQRAHLTALMAQVKPTSD